MNRLKFSIGAGLYCEQTHIRPTRGLAAKPTTQTKSPANGEHESPQHQEEAIDLSLPNNRIRQIINQEDIVIQPNPLDPKQFKLA